MAEEPLQGGGSLAPAAADGVGVMRTAGVRPCPSCNTLISVHATVCPNCGEHVAVKEKSVRCRRCRRRASSNLVICPHCGRELQPATTRWLTWGVPLLALLLLGGLLFARLSRGNPVQWVQAQGERVGRLAESLGNRLQPEFSVVMIPPGQDSDDPLVSQALQAPPDTSVAAPPDALPIAAQPAAAAQPDTDAAADSPAADIQAGEALTPTAAEAPATTLAASDAAAATIATVAATPTTAATATTAATTTAAATGAATPATTAAVAASSRAATATLTITTAPAVTAASSLTVASAATPDLANSLLELPTPTVAAMPTATATLAVLQVHEVQPGDTLYEIATEYDMSVEELLTANNLTEDDVYTIQPGDELVIPAPTPEGAPTATPGPAPATYTVRAGDTIMAIALRLDLTMEALLAANNLTLNEARALQPGDVLALPGAEATPEATATATPVPTVTATTPVTPTATTAPALTRSPTETPAATALRLDPPRLRSPESGTAVSCSGQGTLNWLAVPSISPSDLYLVHLGYVNSIAANGAEEIIWVMTQQRPAGTTSWTLDNDLCGLAPVTEGKQWRWYVEVAEKTADGLQPVSPASAVWGFAWQ